VAMEDYIIQRKCSTKAIGLDCGVSYYFSTIDQVGNFEAVEKNSLSQKLRKLM
jgi:hypothetical protein